MDRSGGQVVVAVAVVGLQWIYHSAASHYPVKPLVPVRLPFATLPRRAVVVCLVILMMTTAIARVTVTVEVGGAGRCLVKGSSQRHIPTNTPSWPITARFWRPRPLYNSADQEIHKPPIYPAGSNSAVLQGR